MDGGVDGRLGIWSVRTNGLGREGGRKCALGLVITVKAMYVVIKRPTDLLSSNC